MYTTTLDPARPDAGISDELHAGMVLHTESPAGKAIIRIATDPSAEVILEDELGCFCRTQVAQSDDGSFVVVREVDEWNEVVVGSRAEIGRYLWDDAESASLSVLHMLGLLKLQLADRD